MARLEEVKRARPQTYLYSYILQPHGHKAVGFKLKYEELGSPEYEDVLGFIRADTDLKIIFLDRDNLFERYVSHYVAVNVTGVTLVKSDQPTPDVQPIILDPLDIEKNFKEESGKKQRFRSLFSSHRSIETTYDKLATDTVPEMNRIYRFLSLPEHTATTTTKKILGGRLQNFIKNYDEILEYFSSTQYACYFEASSDSD